MRLEKNFVITRLGSFARNLRNEVARSKKIYFIDLGLRNALINAFGPIDPIGRNDTGALFENCMVVERLKHIAHQGQPRPNSYFWRTFSKQEIDYVEETGSVSGNIVIKAYEFKWNDNNTSGAKRVFTSAYPKATFSFVSLKNSFSFVVGKL